MQRSGGARGERANAIANAASIAAGAHYVDVTGESPPPSLLSDEKNDACRVVRETPFVALLRPGDALYFPKDWAHHTEAADTTSDTASFSLGFRTDGQYLM